MLISDGSGDGESGDAYHVGNGYGSGYGMINGDGYGEVVEEGEEGSWDAD
jgi:hypothetical protein